MASLPVMGLLVNNHLGERGLFAYVDSTCGFATNYVPFGDVTEARKAPLSGVRTKDHDDQEVDRMRQGSSSRGSRM